MNKKILILDGHPYDQSFCAAITQSYAQNAKNNHPATQIEFLKLRDMQFDPILRAGYKKIQELEPDLQKAQQLLKWCDHLVVITPIWWGGPTALLKGFLDRTFLPGFAFKYRANSSLWDKLLKGRTAHIIVTSDAPTWWMRWIRRDSTVELLKGSTLEFVGFGPVKVTRFGNIKWLSAEKREKILSRVGL